jgi:hypothetical protein
VVRGDGTTAVVAVVQVVPGAGTMYDLEVSHIHTFEVGQGRWVVHNCEPTLPDNPPNLPKRYNVGDATTGELRVSGGAVDVGSARAGPGPGFIPDLPAGTPGFAHNLPGWNHAESDAAAALHWFGGDGILFINNTPCGGCQTYLPTRIPYGSSLQIWYIDEPRNITTWTYGGTFSGDSPLNFDNVCGCVPGT